MNFNIQKASMLKRVSAWMLDVILLVVLITGVASAISAVLNISGYNQQLDALYAKYEKQYGIEFHMTEEEFEKMTEADKELYETAYNALIKDEEVLRVYNLVINLTLVVASFSVLISYLILEFAVPLWLKNGQTIGKKIFGIGVMRTNGTKINTVCLFIRTVLGKCTIETMIPVMVAVMLLLGIVGMDGTFVVMGLIIVQIAMLILTSNNCAIHDKLADTVTVDLASQMIFDTEEDLIEYKKRVAAEEAQNKPYF